MLELPTMLKIIYDIVDGYNISESDKIAYLGSIRGAQNGKYDRIIDSAIIKVLEPRYHKTE